MEFDLDAYPSNILKGLRYKRDWRASALYNLYNCFSLTNSMTFDILILDFHKAIFKVMDLVNMNTVYPLLVTWLLTHHI